MFCQNIPSSYLWFGTWRFWNCKRMCRYYLCIYLSIMSLSAVMIKSLSTREWVLYLIKFLIIYIEGQTWSKRHVLVNGIPTYFTNNTYLSPINRKNRRPSPPWVCGDDRLDSKLPKTLCRLILRAQGGWDQTHLAGVSFYLEVFKSESRSR